MHRELLESIYLICLYPSLAEAKSRRVKDQGSTSTGKSGLSTNISEFFKLIWL